jgi:hypothetical protein
MPENTDIPEELPLADVAKTPPSLPEGDAPKIAATEEVAEIAKENEAMIDIHVPQATHTWEDFWIHLGTIAVGLLIAIGLEQGVEKLHHLEQAHRLADDLQNEAMLNRERVAFDEAALDKEMAWLLLLRRDVSALRQGAAKASFVYPERLEIYPTNPNRAHVQLPAVTVWATAKESDLIPLLPVERARNYNEVYREADLTADDLVGLINRWLDLDKFELRFDGGVPSGKPNVAKMNSEQLDEYVGVLGDLYLSCRTANRRVKIWSAWNESILSPGDKPFESPDEYLRTHPDPSIDLSREKSTTMILPRR